MLRSMLVSKSACFSWVSAAFYSFVFALLLNVGLFAGLAAIATRYLPYASPGPFRALPRRAPKCWRSVSCWACRGRHRISDGIDS